MQRTLGADPVPDHDVWAQVALARLTRLSGAHRAGMALTEGGGRRLHFIASDRDGPGDWCHIDAYLEVPLNTAVRTGEVVLGSLDALAGDYPEFVRRQQQPVVALAAVPITAAGQVLGGFVVFYARPQRFDAAQRRRLVALGELLGTHLRRLQSLRARPPASLADEPVPPGARAASYTVAADPAAVRSARRFVERTLAEWSVDDADTAALCLSELVTNALLHTRSGCEVRVVLEDGVLTTTVRDSGSAVVRADRPAEPLQVHGRGLQLVDALASRWGSELDAEGTTVWFVLEVG